MVKVKRYRKGRWKCNPQDLYDATPGCKGNIISANGGGIKCTLCGGWFCY